MKHGVYVSIPAQVGMMSLVGVMKNKYPVGWGNYFSFAGTRDEMIADTCPRCVNMWAENLEEARRRFLDDGMVRGWLFKEERERKHWKTNEPYTRQLSWFVVCDDRIPVEWLYNKFCWTGGSVPNVEVVTEMYSVYNDHLEELEQFTDRESYYRKQGYDIRYSVSGSMILSKKVE